MINRKVNYSAKSLWSIEELEKKGVRHYEGVVYGNLVSSNVITSDVIIVDDSLTLEWWTEVDPHTIEAHLDNYANVSNIRPIYKFK